jgi:hypothetical protein
LSSATKTGTVRLSYVPSSRAKPFRSENITLDFSHYAEGAPDMLLSRVKRASRGKVPGLTRRTEDAPLAGTHWSVRTLAKHLGLSRMMVQRVWQRLEIQPHRVEKFKLSKDPRFEEKVRDIVGLYLYPPERALVLCVDEKSQIQALDRNASLLPLRPGLPERQTHDYKRYGTTTLYVAFNILTGNNGNGGRCQE